jgi:hypothetical protein
MTALEYVNKITEHGTKIQMPGDKATQVKNRSGLPTEFMETVCFVSESVSDERRVNQIVERITLTALNSATPYQFYKHVLAFLPRQVRQGDYDAEGWTELLSELTLEIANHLSKVAITERNFKGSSTMLTILQARMENWQKKATIAAEKNEEGGIQLTVKID